MIFVKQNFEFNAIVYEDALDNRSFKVEITFAVKVAHAMLEEELKKYTRWLMPVFGALHNAALVDKTEERVINKIEKLGYKVTIFGHKPTNLVLAQHIYDMASALLGDNVIAAVSLTVDNKNYVITNDAYSTFLIV